MLKIIDLMNRFILILINLFLFIFSINIYISFLIFKNKVWNDEFVPTIGVDFKIKNLNIINKNIKL